MTATLQPPLPTPALRTPWAPWTSVQPQMRGRMPTSGELHFPSSKTSPRMKTTSGCSSHSAVWKARSICHSLEAERKGGVGVFQLLSTSHLPGLKALRGNTVALPSSVRPPPPPPGDIPAPQDAPPTPGVRPVRGGASAVRKTRRGQKQGHRGRRCPHQPSGGVTHKGQRVEATQCPQALEVVETEIDGGL